MGGAIERAHFIEKSRAGQIFEIFKCFKCFKKYLKNVSGLGNI